MRSGRLRHRITVEQRTLANDAAGQSTETWATTKWLKNLPARVIETGHVEEAREREQTTSHKRIQIDMRYNRHITSEDRVKFGTRTFHIDGLTVDEVKNGMVLFCHE